MHQMQMRRWNVVLFKFSKPLIEGDINAIAEQEPLPNK